MAVLTNTKSLTRNLSGRARILFAELLAVAEKHAHVLSGRGGVFLLQELLGGMSQDDAARARRRLEALPLRDQRRLLRALQGYQDDTGWPPITVGRLRRRLTPS